MNQKWSELVEAFTCMFSAQCVPKTYLIRYNMSQFKRGQGYSFDMNDPHSFNEKIQWYKFNYYDDRMPQCVDKLGFKDYAQKCLGEDFCAKTLGIWDSIEDLEKAWDSLPEKFCLKSNCMEMNFGVIIVTDKSRFDFKKAKPRITKWLKKKYTLVNSMYTPYKDVEPKIFAEEYIGSADSLVDYKFYCFGGEPYCANATTRRFCDGKILDEGIAYYDTEWNVLKGNVAGRIQKTVEKPECLEKMLDMARKLSSGFPFIRVDFYFTNGRVYTGEVEFYPGAGYGKYEPYEFDLELGDKFVLPPKNTL